MGVDLAVALVPRTLTPFEDRETVQAKIEIPGAAGGLREAMQFDPVELHQGEKVFILMECTVGKIRFDPVKDGGVDAGVNYRVHVLSADMATLVESSFAQGHLDAQRDRIKRARDRAAGILSMFDNNEDDEADDEAEGLTPEDYEPLEGDDEG